MELFETWFVIIAVIFLGYFILKLLSGIGNGIAVSAGKEKDGKLAFRIFIALVIVVVFLSGFFNRN